MSSHEPDASASRIAPITDPESLRDRDDVPFDLETDVVPEETLDAVDAAADMVVVGVTTESGDALLRRLTDDCAWKLPVATVEPGADYVEAARDAVEGVVGLAVELDAVEGVWRIELRDEAETRTAARNFVVFSATPTDGTDLDAALATVPEDDRPVEAGWFRDLPANAEAAPGTDLFVG